MKLANRYAAAKATFDDAEKALKAIRDEIITAMDDAGDDELVGDNLKIVRKVIIQHRKKQDILIAAIPEKIREKVLAASEYEVKATQFHIKATVDQKAATQPRKAKNVIAIGKAA